MQLGMNLMSSIVPMREDYEGCVKRLKEGGCDYFEAMSDWGASPEFVDFIAAKIGGPTKWDPENTVKRIETLKKYGMDIRGMFVFDEIIVEQAEEVGKYCNDNGIKYIVFTFMEYGEIDDIYDKIDTIKKVAAVLRKYNVMVLMHNHEHDVLPVVDRDGVEKPTIEVFLQQCTHEELMLEIDTAWVKYAGLDEVEYVRNHLDRIAVLHLKDICENFKDVPKEEIFVPCGKGCVDYPGVIREGKKKPEMLFVLDQDSSKGDIIEDTIESIKYIKGL